MPKKNKLTDMQLLFCNEYIVDLNGSEAASRAGYSANNSKELAYRLMQKPQVREKIQELMDKRAKRVEVTGDMVVKELSRIAFARMDAVAHWNHSGLTFKGSDELSEDALAAISDISEHTNAHGGSLRIRHHDKVKALELLGKHLKLFPNKVEVTGDEGGAIQFKVVVEDYTTK